MPRRASGGRRERRPRAQRGSRRRVGRRPATPPSGNGTWGGTPPAVSLFRLNISCSISIANNYNFKRAIIYRRSAGRGGEGARRRRKPGPSVRGQPRRAQPRGYMV